MKMNEMEINQLFSYGILDSSQHMLTKNTLMPHVRRKQVMSSIKCFKSSLQSNLKSVLSSIETRCQFISTYLPELRLEATPQHNI